MPSDRPLRILFFMLHSGYIHYRPTLEVLADRGHSIHLAFTRIERLTRATPASPTSSPTGTRTSRSARRRQRRSDGWRPIAGLTRQPDRPRSLRAPALRRLAGLRARMARKLTEHVTRARTIDR
jgi:hypothetical protein